MNEHFEAIQEVVLEKEDKKEQKKNTKESAISSVLEFLKKETQAKIQKYKDTIQQLENKLQLKEEEIKRLIELKKNLEEELKISKEQLESIEKEKERLLQEESELKAIIEQLREKEAKEEMYKNAVIKSLEAIATSINQTKQLALDEIKTIIYTVLETIYAKCTIDIDSIIKSIFEDSKIFKDFIVLKANKTFIETFKKYVKLIDNIEFEFIEENFEDGEFQIETKDFVIERFNKDMIKDAVEKALQNIR